MENKYKIKKKAVNQQEIKQKKETTTCLVNNLKSKWKQQQMTNHGDGAVLKVEFQKGKLKRNQKQKRRKKNMVANLDVNNLKSEWDHQTNRDRYV